MISGFTGSNQAHFKWSKPLKSVCKRKEEPNISSNVETKNDCEQILKSKDLVDLVSFLVQSQMEEHYISLKETTSKSNDAISDIKKELTALKSTLKENGF